MKAEEIIEQIMTQHWDMAACNCWVCEEGRKLGLGPREIYLRNKKPCAEVEMTQIMDKIEHSCIIIIGELKKGKFSESQLEFLKKLFTEVVKITDKLLEKEEISNGRL